MGIHHTLNIVIEEPLHAVGSYIYPLWEEVHVQLLTQEACRMHSIEQEAKLPPAASVG